MVTRRAVLMIRASNQFGEACCAFCGSLAGGASVAPSGAI